MNSGGYTGSCGLSREARLAWGDDGAERPHPGTGIGARGVAARDNTAATTPRRTVAQAVAQYAVPILLCAGICLKRLLPSL